MAIFLMPQVKEVRANIETHPAFGEALEEAKQRLLGLK